MAKSAFDPKAAAARKKKQAIALGLVFAALLAFQLPRTLKMLHGSAPAQAASSSVAQAPTSSAASPPPAPTAPSAELASSTSGDAADALVVNADLQPAPLQGQLTDLTTFRSKDPFVQQVDSSPSASSPSSAESSRSPAAAAAAAAAAKAAPAKAAAPPKQQPQPARTAVPSATPSTAPPVAPHLPAAPPPAPTSAVLSVNGIQEGVNVGSDFPANDPLFHLVSLTTKSGKISIAGGSLSSGKAAVTVEVGKPTTLMNTADGTRYVILLVSVGATAAAPTTATPASTP